VTYDPDEDPTVQFDRFVRQALFGLEDATETAAHWNIVAAQYALRPEAMVNDRMRAALIAGFEEIHQTLSEIVSAGIEEDTIDANDPDMVATIILGIIDSARGGKVVLGSENAPEQMYLALTELVYPSLGIDPPE
jgi:hypothetical protein